MEYYMEEKEIEAIEVASKVSSNECPNCGEPIDGSVCKKCGERGLKENYFDPDYDKYEREIEQANKEYFSNIDWEEVKD
jgi:hypothetical protein